MTRHAYQFRPIRGRRFDGGRLVGTLILIGALVFGVLFWWAMLAVLGIDALGWLP